MNNIFEFDTSDSLAGLNRLSDQSTDPISLSSSSARPVNTTPVITEQAELLAIEMASSTAQFSPQQDSFATRDLAPTAPNLADSLTVTSERLANWGLGEGVGTGELPDGLFSCGCGGTCPSCSGGGSSSENNFAPNTNSFGATVNLDQTVFLDFDSGIDANIDYTPQLRDAVQAQMEQIYAAFGVTFVQTAPTEGDFSTLVFNAGTPGGLAEDIDFRNQNKNDNAVINVVGFGQINTPAQIISASAIIGAHELGHILGLRHHDAFGTIGAGIPGNLFFPGFLPAFPGPELADETTDHILNTPALAGAVTDVLTPSWFGEREAAKLAFAANGTVLFESNAPNDTFGQAQEIELSELLVPNTIVSGENADAGDFLVDAVTVIGSFTFVDQLDLYSFQGEVGRAYSFEVISQSINRIVDFVDPTIRIFDSSFTLVDYFGTPAFNDDDIETFDSHLFDLQLPENGTYFVEIDTFSNGDAGSYELYINSFEIQPFNLPLVDDHTDILSTILDTDLVFESVSNNVLARIDGVVGFDDSPLERDVFGFTINTEARVIVDVRSTSNFFNSFVELFDTSGNRIAFNDDNTNPSLDNDFDSQFVVNDLEAGDYFVAVSGTNGSTGSYRLGVRHNGATGAPDDHGDSFNLATNLALSPLPNTTFVNASAELGTDDDFFRFTSLGTGRLVVRSLALNGDLNTVLRGYDAQERLVDANNNFNGSLDSRISLDVVAGQSYFVRLSTVGETSGDYRLSLRTVQGSTSSGSANGFALSDPNVRLDLASDQTLDDLIAGSDVKLGRIDQYSDSRNGHLT